MRRETPLRVPGFSGPLVGLLLVITSLTACRDDSQRVELDPLQFAAIHKALTRHNDYLSEFEGYSEGCALRVVGAERTAAGTDVWFKGDCGAWDTENCDRPATSEGEQVGLAHVRGTAVTFEFPRDGSALQPDIKRMTPKRYQGQMLHHDDHEARDLSDQARRAAGCR